MRGGRTDALTGAKTDRDPLDPRRAILPPFARRESEHASERYARGSRTAPGNSRSRATCVEASAAPNRPELLVYEQRGGRLRAARLGGACRTQPRRKPSKPLPLFNGLGDVNSSCFLDDLEGGVGVLSVSDKNCANDQRGPPDSLATMDGDIPS